MLGVGKPFPQFQLKAVVSADPKTAFQVVSNETFQGRWLVVFSYPKDFTFVCPTELKGFADLEPHFREREAQLLSLSTDSEFVHLAWRQAHPHLTHLPYPMLSDIKRTLGQQLGILDEAEGVAQRATYIVDPQGIIRFVYVTDMSVGRNPKEVLRILDGLQSNELVPCGWQKGEATLSAGRGQPQD